MEATTTGHEVSTYVSLLKACSKTKDLVRGCSIHVDVVTNGLLQWSPHVGSSLISMYVKCGMLRKAFDVLLHLVNRNVISWNALITGYAQWGQPIDAFLCFERMQNEGLLPDETTLSCLLKACSHMQNVEMGRRIHNVVMWTELLGKDLVLGNALVEMYVKCGKVTEAEKVLDKLPIRNVVAWSSLILGYTNQGKAKEALTCFERMRNEGIYPNTATLLPVLKACGIASELDKGKQIHEEIICKGLFTGEIRVGTALMDMYAKCGMLANAKNVLDELLFPDVISWNMLISGYVQHGIDETALNSLNCMKNEGLFPNSITFICLLRACGRTGSITIGKQIHNELIGICMVPNHTTLSNGLMDMYAKCGEMAHAQKVLDEIPDRNLVSWNILISGYVQQGQGGQALECFELLQAEGLFPNAITYTCILKACAVIGAIQKGNEIHGEIDKQGLLKVNLALGTALVDMYAKCGDMPRAEKALLQLPVRNVVTWSAVIAGYSEHEKANEALHCFEQMQREGFSPDHVTFISVLKACGTIGALTEGLEVHSTVVNHGLTKDVMICNALIDMYAKCGALEKARQLFDEIPFPTLASWNALMAGYVQHGDGEAALSCFNIVQKQGLSLDAITFTSALKACTLTGAIYKGREIQDEIVHRGLLGKDIILSVVLIDMYAKCGSMEDAQLVFDKLLARNELSWNTLIAGYTQHGQGEDALTCFELMQIEGFFPDRITVICILKACASIGVIGKGIDIHDAISSKEGFLVKDQEVMLGNALVDMYAKCGDLAKARCVLNDLPSRNVVSWNVIIKGCAQDGQGEEALVCFGIMQEDGVYPDAVTFLSLLYACSHSGLVNEAEMCFIDMNKRYGLLPDLDHFTCMVDLFGRAGHIEKAIGIIQEMPYYDHPPVWIALLGSCRSRGDVKVGRLAFDQSIQIYSTCAAAYLLMREIYIAAGMPKDALGIDTMRKKNV